MSFVYDNTKTYELKVDIASENPGNPLSDSYDISMTCFAPTPTPTNTPTSTPTPTATPTNTPTLTPTAPPPTDTPTPTPAPSYNYYTFAPCGFETGTDYRSILALQINDVYTFLPYGPGEPDRACYTITSITAATNTNDLPTIYGPVDSGCESIYCQQL
jgi:hypothetical protein